MRIQLWLLASFLIACRAPALPEGGKWVKPVMGKFQIQIETMGQVEAQQPYYLSSAFGGKLKKLAENGQEVNKGDVVATLDTRDTEEELAEAETTLEVARNDLSEHHKNLSSEKIRLRANCERASKELALKQLKLKHLLAGTPPQDQQKLALTLKQSQAALVLVEAEVPLKENLAKRGIVSELDVLQSRLVLANRRKEKALAEAAYTLSRRGPTVLARQWAEWDVKLAQNNVQMELLNQRQQLNLLQIQGQKFQLKVQTQSKEVQLLQQRMQSAVFRAPTDGTVLLSKIPTEKGLSLVKLGDEIRQGTPFMAIADLSQVLVRAEVEEQYARNLKKSLTCQARLPGRKGEAQTLKIQQVGVVALEPQSSTVARPELGKIFEVELLPLQQKGFLKPGTTVDLEIPLKKIEQALLLPRSTIVREGSHHWVQLNDGQRREVKLGDSNTREVTVLSGLNVDDQVWLPEKNR